MSVCPILRLPHSVLGEVAKPVTVVDEEALSLMSDLMDTMQSFPGCVGLAAPQIGVSKRAFVVDVSGHRYTRSCHGLIAMFDPVVLEVDDYRLAREGCMSVPELTGDVERPFRVLVQGIGMDGEIFSVESDAYEARALMHEIDHLDGLLFLDRVVHPSQVYPRKVRHTDLNA